MPVVPEDSERTSGSSAEKFSGRRSDAVPVESIAVLKTITGLSPMRPPADGTEAMTAFAPKCRATLAFSASVQRESIGRTTMPRRKAAIMVTT